MAGTYIEEILDKLLDQRMPGSTGGKGLDKRAYLVLGCDEHTCALLVAISQARALDCATLR